MAIQQLRPHPTQEKAGEINKFEKKAVAEGNKALRVFEKTYKAGLKEAVTKAVGAGVDKAWAEAYFKDFYEEQEDMLAESFDDDAYEAGRKMKDMSASIGSSLKLAIKDLENCFRKTQNVVKDYEDEQGTKNIQQVKQAGEKIAKDPKQKIALLKKLGLNGAEFHAFCLMVKEQIK